MSNYDWNAHHRARTARRHPDQLASRGPQFLPRETTATDLDEAHEELTAALLDRAKRQQLGDPMRYVEALERVCILQARIKSIRKRMEYLGIAPNVAEDAVSWPPRCPTCGAKMSVRRQRSNGSNLPFFSCGTFPRCRGRMDFVSHPDDLATAKGDEQEARYVSLERARADGLIIVTAGAQRRARMRDLEQERAKQ